MRWWDWLFWAVCTLLLTGATVAVIAGVVLVIGQVTR